jgi:hypothetical protein
MGPKRPWLRREPSPRTWDLLAAPRTPIGLSVFNEVYEFCVLRGTLADRLLASFRHFSGPPPAIEGIIESVSFGETSEFSFEGK